MHDIEVYDLYDVWYQPWWQSTTAKIIGGIIAVLLVCVLVWLLMRIMRAKKSITYWQKALDQCAQLRKNSDTLELPILYAHLTALFKDYLSKRYKQQLKSLTDKELLHQFLELPFSETQKAMIQEMLTYAVPVKFDSYQESLADPLIHIDLLERFIKETHPQNSSKISSE